MKFWTAGSLKLRINRVRRTNIEIKVIAIRLKSLVVLIFSFKCDEVSNKDNNTILFGLCCGTLLRMQKSCLGCLFMEFLVCSCQVNS